MTYDSVKFVAKYSLTFTFPFGVSLTEFGRWDTDQEFNFIIRYFLFDIMINQYQILNKES